MSDMIARFNVGDRLQVGTDLCTVRYSGVIDKWPETIAYGLEWDDSARGKHSGSYNGSQLFRTSVEGAGSLIKESALLKKMAPKRTFWEVLQEVYETTNDNKKEDNKDITFNTKHVKRLGFEKLDNMNKDYSNLKVISLNKKSIDKVSDPKINHDTTLNVKCLDLGFNCVSNISELTHIARHCPYLQELNISGNRFTLKKEDSLKVAPIPQVKRLFLASCGIGKEVLNILVEMFPNLEFLDISLNRLTDDDLIGLRFPSTLKELILNGNKLKSLPIRLNISNLEYLDMSGNVIEHLFTGDNRLKSLLSLNITSNKILDWEVLDEINTVFPLLTSIKINKNPIVGNLEEQARDADVPYYQVIARLEKIQHIDGLFVSKELRETAESYFIFNMEKEGYKMSNNLERWHHLSSRYLKKPHAIIKPAASTFISDSLLQLNIKNIKEGDESFTVNILDTWSVRALKGRIASLTRSNILSLKLFLFDLKERQYLDKEFSRIKDYYITSGDDVYYEKHD